MASPVGSLQLSKRSHHQDTQVKEGGRDSKRRRFFRENARVSDPSSTVTACKSSLNRTPSPDAEAAHAKCCLESGKRFSMHSSTPHGLVGHMTNLEPIFAPDEKHLLLGLDNMVQVFSLSTYQHVQSLQVTNSEKIIGYKLSPVTEHHLYIISSTGRLSRWDWISGKQVTKWAKRSKILMFDICPIIVEKNTQIACFFLYDLGHGRRDISVSLLDEITSPKKLDDVVILETARPINSMKIVQGGRVLIVSDDQHLLIGCSSASSFGCPESLIYTWRVVMLPVTITSLDVRESKAVQSIKSAIPGNPTGGPSNIDLVVGEQGGSILIYEDILKTFRRNEDKYLPILRKLHWHRDAVSVVRWSRDGNYILSGGKESVIVLWQLDSGRRNFLPHLSSYICNLVISPTGKLYAIKLANNSLIILSAAELQPVATITGLQLPAKIPKIQNVGLATINRSSDNCSVIPAILHPLNTDHLLIAVPSRHSDRDGGQQPENLSVLQTFNVRTGSNVYRQALARTNTTAMDNGPEGMEILTPSIKHLGLSSDGKWLVTVDSWSPHIEDVKALDPCWDRVKAAVQAPHEILLKFWLWNDAAEVWEIATRIDAPHFRFGEGAAPVLGVASHPNAYVFATVGTDCILRLWVPTVKRHHGTNVQYGEIWRCKAAIHLDGKLGAEDDVLTSASICFSEDGSIIAVCLQTLLRPNSSIVHFIDIHECKIRHSRIGSNLGSIYAAKFLGRYLVVASEKSISIWDIVGDFLMGVTSPGLHTTTSSNRKYSTLFAANPQTQTIAVITKPALSNENAMSGRQQKTCFNVEVYCLHSPIPLFRSSLENHPLALLSDPKTGDFLLVDAAANLQRVTCHNINLGTVAPSDGLSIKSKSGLNDVFWDHSTQHLSPKSSAHVPAAAVDAETPTLQYKRLAPIFDVSPPFSLPLVSVLFKNVVHSLTSDSRDS